MRETVLEAVLRSADAPSEAQRNRFAAFLKKQYGQEVPLRWEQDPALEKGFPVFLREKLPQNPEKAEYYLPMAVDAEMQAGRASVSVKTTHDKWYGVTYREDLASVKEAVARMKAEGIYTEELWK